MHFRRVLRRILAHAIAGHALAGALICSSCVVPKLDLKRLPADAGTNRDTLPVEGCDDAADACGGSDGGAGRSTSGGKGGTANVGGRGGAAGTGGAAGKGEGGSVGSVDGGRDAGDEPDEPDETRAGAGGSGGNGGSIDAGVDAGAGGDGTGGTGGNGGSIDAGVDAGAGGNGSGGTGGAGGESSSAPTYCSTWRRQNSDGVFDDLGPNPGEEMNDSGTVRQYICRTVPNGRSQLALGKGVPPYGCYGTYDNSGTRLGYGKATDFEVLLPNTSDCQVTWQSVSTGITPFDLGTAEQPGLYACRGRLENVPSDGGGNISGRELGQWVEVAGERQCWTQFHNSTAGMDTGSKRVVDQLEILVRAP
jgi:hypothetical protein